MIKAAIFDMDGLLIDSEPLWLKVNREVYKSLGVEITPEIRLNMIGRPTLENAENLYRRYRWQGPSPRQVEARLRKEMVKLIGQGIALMPGADRTLQICKKAGLPVAIASSSTVDIIDTVVDALEIREHFDHIYSAQFEPYGKPHPGVFLKVSEHLKVSPHDCLVFEDSPAGVLAAKAARMVCVAVPEPTSRGNKFINTADLILDSLEKFDAATLKQLGDL
jgi:sugar-phosphatase